MNKNILWLPGWYPNILSPYDGDFIQRHARAAALFQKVTVIYIKKDEKGMVTQNKKIITSSQHNVNEIIVFYRPVKTGIKFLDRLFSAIKYKKTYREVLSNYIKETGKPDLVHVHVALKAGIQALWLKKIFNIPFVLTEHWTGYLPEAKFGLKDLSIFQKQTIQKIFKASNKITVVSDVLGKAISKQFDISEYTILPNVVDTSVFFPEDHPENSPVQFIHISSLQYQKNISAIIEAFVLIKKKGYVFRLLIYGPAASGLKQLAKKDLGESIQFKNEVPQTELAPSLRTSDALILYSHYETFGCVVIEANACGIPAILSNLSVFKEYIKEYENGIFVTPDNPAELANKIEDFILGKYKFNKQSIAEKAAKDFNYQTIGSQFAAIYENLLTN